MFAAAHKGHKEVLRLLLDTGTDETVMPLVALGDKDMMQAGISTPQRVDVSRKLLMLMYRMGPNQS